jgi:hypothetical protein
MPKVEFTKDTMLEILEVDEDVISDKITSTSRWSNIHTLIFKKAGKLYRTNYSVGATEQQEEYPWDHVKTVECTEVEAYEKTVVAYRDVTP